MLIKQCIYGSKSYKIWHKTVSGCQQDIQCGMIKLLCDITVSHCATSVIHTCLQQCTSNFTAHAHTTSQHPMLPVFKKIKIKELKSNCDCSQQRDGEILAPGKTVRTLLKS